MRSGRREHLDIAGPGGFRALRRRADQPRLREEAASPQAGTPGDGVSLPSRPTALSGRPTTRNLGRPLAICTCTSTARASSPRNATVATCATMRKGPFFAILLWRDRSDRSDEHTSELQTLMRL